MKFCARLSIDLEFVFIKFNLRHVLIFLRKVLRINNYVFASLAYFSFPNYCSSFSLKNLVCALTRKFTKEVKEFFNVIKKGLNG